jgi:Phosphoesterase family
VVSSKLRAGEPFPARPFPRGRAAALSLFRKTLSDGNMPSVSFLKPPAAQNAHPANSDPLDEQAFLVSTINQIERSHFWPSRPA